MSEQLDRLDAVWDQSLEYMQLPGVPAMHTWQLAERFVGRYEEPWRRYHVVNHLADGLQFLVENADRLRQPRVAFWTQFGHDSFYLPRLEGVEKGLNEELSAQLTEHDLEPYLPKDEVFAIGDNIRRSADHKCEVGESDLAYFMDGDLKILGAPPEEFDEYDENIGREFSYFDPALYRAARYRVLLFAQHDAQKGRIYKTAVGRERYEAPAKANLERILPKYAPMVH